MEKVSIGLPKTKGGESVARRRLGDVKKFVQGPNSLATGFLDEVQHVTMMKGAEEETVASFIRGKHFEIFGNKAPGVHIDVVKARVIYKLQFEGFRKAGKSNKLPENFAENQAAALANKPEEFHHKTKCLFRDAIIFNREKKKERKVMSPKKGKKDKKGRAKKVNGEVVSIKSFVRDIFKKSKEIDTPDIIKQVCKAFPWSAFGKSHVAYYRNLFRKEGIDIPMRQEKKKKKAKKGKK